MNRVLVITIIGGIILLYIYHYSGGVRALLRRIIHWFAGEPTRREEPRVVARRAKEDPAEQAELAKYERFVQEVSALTVEEAERRAGPILCDRLLWRNEGDPPEDPDRLRFLGPTLRALFTSGARVTALYGEINLSRDEIAPAIPPVPDALSFSTTGPAVKRLFYRVGMDMDGNPVVVERGQDMIYIVHRASGMDGKSWTTTYPSVYHWLLVKHYAMQRRKENGG